MQFASFIRYITRLTPYNLVQCTFWYPENAAFSGCIVKDYHAKLITSVMNVVIVAREPMP